jgi:S1-C subfamily serine protease
MKTSGLRTALICAATVAAVLAAPPASAWADSEADFSELLAKKSPAIVSIKYVLKIKSQFGENENERETAGVVIEPDGLLLCANSQLGAGSWMRRAGGSATPTDIKVLIGDDAEGLDAEIIARDSELDLTWPRIKEPGDRKFSAISLKKGAVPEIGQRIYSVSRLGKYFDRVAVVREARLGGVTHKPRKLFVPSGGSGSLGLPVYTANGQVIGVAISQMPGPGEMQGPGGFYGASGLILPADEVIKATQRALEAARDEEEDEEEGDDE